MLAASIAPPTRGPGSAALAMAIHAWADHFERAAMAPPLHALQRLGPWDTCSGQFKPTLYCRSSAALADAKLNPPGLSDTGVDAWLVGTAGDDKLSRGDVCMVLSLVANPPTRARAD